MTTGYVYGSYLNFQINLDPGKTKSRYQAKWRSQIPVRLDLGFYLTVGEDEYWRIENTTEASESNFSVNVVHIDDLDFQIKSTREVDDFFWIYKAPVAIIGGRAPIGQDLSIRDTYVPVERNLDTSNPNGDRFTAPVLVAKPVIIPTFVDFAPIRLELGYDYGAVGGPEFKTDTIETADGTQQRNALHYLPLGRWQLGDRALAESEADLLTEVSYLKSFHEARRGSYQGFRYKDWADYYARDSYIATGDGIRTEFQLRKAYRAGDAVTYRPIQKPVFGTVELFVDGVNVAVDIDHEWEVNHDTGVISHPEPLPEGAVLSANFEFDVPVWFESDEIGFSLQAYEPESGDSIYRLESVFVVEGRIPLTLPWEIENATEINQPLELGIIYDTIEKSSFSTDKLALSSGFIRREGKREDTLSLVDIGDRIFDREELDRLLGYFYCARGKSKQFPLIDKQQKYLTNWEGDRLNIKFSGSDSNDALYSLSGLKLNLTKYTIFLGFTAATGTYSQRHIIKKVILNDENISATDLFFNGAANRTEDGIREIILTNDKPFESGSVYFDRRIDLYKLKNLKIYFNYSIDSAQSNRDFVADGMAFIIQASSQAFEALSIGKGLGYSGIDRSVAVEFDTFFNSGHDNSNNHIAININGSIDNKGVQSAFAVNPDFDIRGDRHCWIEYESPVLKVYLSPTQNKPVNHLLERIVDWEKIL